MSLQLQTRTLVSMREAKGCSRRTSCSLLPTGGELQRALSGCSRAGASRLSKGPRGTEAGRGGSAQPLAGPRVPETGLPASPRSFLAVFCVSNYTVQVHRCCPHDANFLTVKSEHRKIEGSHAMSARYCPSQPGTAASGEPTAELPRGSLPARLTPNAHNIHNGARLASPEVHHNPHEHFLKPGPVWGFGRLSHYPRQARARGAYRRAGL